MAIITTEKVKQYLDITDTTYDAKIALLIPVMEAWVKKYTNNTMLDADGLDEYPTGIDYPVALLIGYELKERLSKKSGVSSESLGDWSASYSEIQSGYPNSILSLFKPFRQITFK
jgi:hypothetical protein